MGQIRWPKTCRVLAGAGHQKAREKLAVLSWIQLRINGCCRRGQKELILSLLSIQFLSSEISYNFKVAIIGHLHCTEFDRNDRPIFSLYQSVKTHGLVSTDLF